MKYNMIEGEITNAEPWFALAPRGLTFEEWCRETAAEIKQRCPERDPRVHTFMRKGVKYCTIVDLKFKPYPYTEA